MRNLREKAGMSSVDVAYHLGIAESTVRNWDVGRTLPTFAINEVPKVLKLFQCTLEEMAAAIEASREEFLAKEKSKKRKGKS